MDSDLICIVATDVDHSVDAGFNEWYEQHIIEVVQQPGWVRATRYRCLDGQPRYLAIYDIASREQAAIGSYTRWPEAMRRIQDAGYERYWPHIASYRARNYERISQVLAPPMG
jgi:hypothetical protein